MKPFVGAVIVLVASTSSSLATEPRDAEAPPAAAAPVVAPAPAVETPAATPARASLEVMLVLVDVDAAVLPDLGLDGTSVDGLATPSERESPFKTDVRLFTLEERGQARIVARPMVHVEEGTPARITSESGKGREEFEILARRAGESFVVDVAHGSGKDRLRASGPIGHWAMLHEGARDGEVRVIFVRSSEIAVAPEAPPDEAPASAPASAPAPGGAPAGAQPKSEN